MNDMEILFLIIASIVGSIALALGLGPLGRLFAMRGKSEETQIKVLVKKHYHCYDNQRNIVLRVGLYDVDNQKYYDYSATPEVFYGTQDEKIYILERCKGFGVGWCCALKIIAEIQSDNK